MNSQISGGKVFQAETTASAKVLGLDDCQSGLRGERSRGLVERALVNHGEGFPRCTEKDEKNMVSLLFSRVIRGLCLLLEDSAVGLPPGEQRAVSGLYSPSFSREPVSAALDTGLALRVTSSPWSVPCLRL